MNRFTKFIALLSGACFILLYSPGYAGYLGGGGGTPGKSLQDSEGGSETILYKSDTVVMENTVTEEGEVIEPPKPELINMAAGLSAYYSNNVQIYYLPLSYVVTERIAVNASVPYISRDLEAGGETYSASGLGDIKIGGAYFTLLGDELTGISPALENLRGVTYLNITAPTGDAEAEDKGVAIPLGNGGFSVNVKQTLTKKIEPVRVFGNIGLIYYLPAEYKPAGGSVKITEEKGMVFSILVGCEYLVMENLYATGKINFVMIGEGRYKWSGTWYDSNDAMQTSDLIVGGKYVIMPGVLSAYVAIVIPVYTGHDPDAADPRDRSFGANFGVTGLF